jgi:hypothetical protein
MMISSRRQFLKSGAFAMVATGVRGQAPGKPDLSSVKALVFDTFGTVVDWRSSVIAEGEKLGNERHVDVDWAKFADAWRAGYGPSMDRAARVRCRGPSWMRCIAGRSSSCSSISTSPA